MSEDVEIWRTWLGAFPCSVYTSDAVGGVGKQASLLILPWKPHQNGDGNKGIKGRGSLVVAVTVYHVENTSVIL